MIHDLLSPHELLPRMQPDGTVYCATCDAKLSPEECEATNWPRFAHYLDDAQRLVNDIRNAEIDAANLRLVEGPGPAEREAVVDTERSRSEDENSRMD